MKYAGIMKNDIINGKGICVSLWTQGCPHHCPGCWNPETWDPQGGVDVPANIKGTIIKGLSANGVQRNFSVLGGEPLAPYNRHFVKEIIEAVRIAYSDITIYLWTGYVLEELQSMHDNDIDAILSYVDVLIDGQYDATQRDITLDLRGSRNQRVIKLKELNNDKKK